MKLTLSNLSQSTITVSLAHAASYIDHLDSLDKMYQFKSDCKSIAASIIVLLKTLPQLTVAGLALGVVRTIIELSDIAGEWSGEEFTYAISTSMKLIESEMEVMIERQRQGRKKTKANRRVAA